MKTTKRQQKARQQTPPAGNYYTIRRRDGRAVRVFIPTGR